MSWPRRLTRRQALLGAVGLTAVAGCGFAPAYGPAGRAQALRGQVAMPNPGNSTEVQLIARLEDRLGPAGQNPAWALRFDLSLQSTGQGVNPDQETTRINLRGQLRWAVRRRDGTAAEITGVEQSFTSYSTTANTAATLAAEADAEQRLMVVLADQLAASLLLALAHPDPA